MVLCQEVWPLVRYHRWEHFCMIPKESAVVPIVQEFYESLRDQESKRTEGSWETVLVRGKEEEEEHVNEEESNDEEIEESEEMDFEEDD
ncbi:hypothetical protein Goari_004564 [Gossypium aridum]|uniref:Uncharacterized protein n=1 Tax=Gossypium aridum TaxID=34290 RepID=A0A7J8Y3U2_GOSAI|nr:hypothetical protein [Gossypium aridum]